MIKSQSPNETSKYLIETSNLRKSFSLGKQTLDILKGVDIKISRGEFIALMGPSGSGKSTLLNILGLLDYPTSGTYKLIDTEVSKIGSNTLSEIRNKKIGFIFQSFNLLPKLTALENVAVPSLFAGEEKNDKALELLQSVGLQDRISHYPNELSGGQKQRVAIARALINDPELILADEPTGNLDSVSGKDVMNIIVDLHKEGRTIVMVTHDEELAKFADKVIHIKDGVVEKIL